MSGLLNALTGQDALNEANQINRENYDYNKQLDIKDRGDLMSIFDQMSEAGLFNPDLLLSKWDKAADPRNARDLKSVGAALRQQGARAGDTNTDSAIAMTLNAQKQNRADRALSFFQQAFKDRFAVRQAISNVGRGGATSAAGQNLANSLTQQGLGQQAQFNAALGTILPFTLKPTQGGASGGTKSAVSQSIDSGLPSEGPNGVMYGLPQEVPSSWGGGSVPTNNGMTSFFDSQQKWLS